MHTVAVKKTVRFSFHFAPSRWHRTFHASRTNFRSVRMRLQLVIGRGLSTCKK